MTEYEMAYLLNEYQNSITLQSSGAFTTVTAFLAAGYVAGHRLSRFMLGTVIALYTIWLWGLVAGIVRHVNAASALFKEIARFASEGKGLEWHPVVTGLLARSEWEHTVVIAVTLVGFAAIYIASLTAFLQWRRTNRKTEAGEWKPRV